MKCSVVLTNGHSVFSKDQIIVALTKYDFQPLKEPNYRYINQTKSMQYNEKSFPTLIYTHTKITAASGVAFRYLITSN